MYVDPEITEKKAKRLIASSRYSDDMNGIGVYLGEFDRVSEILEPYKEIVPTPKSITNQEMS